VLMTIVDGKIVFEKTDRHPNS